MSAGYPISAPANAPLIYMRYGSYRSPSSVSVSTSISGPMASLSSSRSPVSSSTSSSASSSTPSTSISGSSMPGTGTGFFGRSGAPPLGRRAQWRLISSLALNHLSLVADERGLEAFRELLAIHDFAETPATAQLIGGVTRVSSSPDTARTGQRGRNTVCRGVRVTVDLDEGHFVGNSAFLLASVLERFLGLYVSVNSFSRLVARTGQPRRTIKQWPPRAGERILL